MADYPSSPPFATTKLRSVQQAFVDRSQNGRSYARKTTGHQWFFTATYQDLRRDQFDPIFAFAMEQDGQYGTFTICPPDKATPRGSAGGSPLVNGAAQTGTSLDIKGCTASQTNWLRKGDIFTLSGDLKVYMITQDIDSDVSGNATLTFRPALEISPDDEAVITVNNVCFTMRFASAPREYSVRPPVLYDYEIDLEEAS